MSLALAPFTLYIDEAKRRTSNNGARQRPTGFRGLPLFEGQGCLLKKAHTRHTRPKKSFWVRPGERNWGTKKRRISFSQRNPTLIPVWKDKCTTNGWMAMTFSIYKEERTSGKKATWEQQQFPNCPLEWVEITERRAKGYNSPWNSPSEFSKSFFLRAFSIGRTADDAILNRATSVRADEKVDVNAKM